MCENWNEPKKECDVMGLNECEHCMCYKEFDPLIEKLTVKESSDVLRENEIQ